MKATKCKERGRKWRGRKEIGEVAAWLHRQHWVWFLIRLITFASVISRSPSCFSSIGSSSYCCLVDRKWDDFEAGEILYLNGEASIVAFHRSEGGCTVAITMWMTPDWGIKANVDFVTFVGNM